MATATRDIEQLAKKAANNHARFDSFAWFARPDDSENWTLVYTDNRDSGPLDRANAKAIAKALEPFTEEEEEGTADVVAESHSHFAVGYVNGYAIRVYRDGQITEAFALWVELQARMDDYPVLDEGLHSAECSEEEEEGWENWARREFQRELEKLFGVDDIDWIADPPGDVGRWVEQPAELFPTGKPRTRYVYNTPNSESAFRGLFDTLCQRSNTYWEEDSSGMYIRIGRVVESAEWEDVRPFVIDAEMYEDNE